MRRELSRDDFDQLADAGFTLTGVPVSHGGIWGEATESTRHVCEILRILAHGDPSVALVAAMHPGVLLLGFGGQTPPAPGNQFGTEWDAQRDWAYQCARDGNFWGTITSEAGSGGDVSRTRSSARAVEDGYVLTGSKHFGSGTGITSFVITTAVPEGEDVFDEFFLDLRDVPLDGTAGVEVIAPWDGHGMTATQSHAVKFTDFPAKRRAWHNAGGELRPVASPSIACMFASVIVGVVEVAVETARQQLSSKKDRLSSYEQVEWSRVEMEAWQVQQLHEGMLRAIADETTRARQTLLGKTSISDIAETLLTRLSRAIGGSSFSRQMPYGQWAQDVRALGFLRPPWSLAFDQLHRSTWGD
ncbi:MAG: acyl-CoA/acyl-ACP dehydrogenase [Chloroflexi bacterium]|nr:acyl-CoA/acyl-ACP dehydrogenase [Chloroflexota bacterium]